MTQKRLTEKYVHLLKPGDNISLDMKAALSVLYLRHGNIQYGIRSAGIKDGADLTYNGKRAALKSGEGTVLGWHLDTVEIKSGCNIPYEYFAIDEDLETRLKIRRQKLR